MIASRARSVKNAGARAEADSSAGPRVISSALYGVPRLPDVSVPACAAVPASPGNPASERVGIDYLSIEQFRRAGAPAPRALRALPGHGVIIVDGLIPAETDARTYEMYCLPLRIAGADGAPARVVLKP